MRRLVAIAALLALLLAACGSDDSGTSDPQSAQGGSGGGSATASGQDGCTKVEAPAPKPDGGEKKPSRPLDASKDWTLVVKTNCGDFTIALDLDSAPRASASMVSLANAGFFENTVFHRIVPGFVIQGGDPTGSGSGGPGYSTVDPPPKDARYTRGVVAMAKTQTEPPGTAGSQFYVVTGADAGLPPDYAIIGKVTEGLDTVERIGQLGGPDEQPTQPVVISDVVATGS